MACDRQKNKSGGRFRVVQRRQSQNYRHSNRAGRIYGYRDIAVGKEAGEGIKNSKYKMARKEECLSKTTGKFFAKNFPKLGHRRALGFVLSIHSSFRAFFYFSMMIVTWISVFMRS